MKKVLITILALIGQKANAQIDVFPANDTAMIIGKEVRVKPKDKMLEAYGYEGFYKDEKLKKVFDCCTAFNAKVENLKNKVFKVEAIIPNTNFSKLHFVLKLHNTELGIVYFDYNPEYSFKWPFEFVGDFKVPKDFYCRNVDMKYDKFTGDTTFFSEMFRGIVLYKIKAKQGQISYFMSKIGTTNTTILVEKGVTILFANGKRIERPEVEVKYKGIGYKNSNEYISTFELTESEIKLLLESPITDIRMFLFDTEINKGETLIEYLKCLIEK